VTLFIKNETGKEVYIFVTRGRADGIRIAVKEGKGFEIRDLRDEPDVGLTPEVKLFHGETHTQRYPLSQWLLLKEPGYYTVECAIQIESYNLSLRQNNEDRLPTNVIISTFLYLRILPRAG
jgi:hypothetical protein